MTEFPLPPWVLCLRATSSCPPSCPEVEEKEGEPGWGGGGCSKQEPPSRHQGTLCHDACSVRTGTTSTEIEVAVAEKDLFGTPHPLRALHQNNHVGHHLTFNGATGWSQQFKVDKVRCSVSTFLKLCIASLSICCMYTCALLSVVGNNGDHPSPQSWQTKPTNTQKTERSYGIKILETNRNRQHSTDTQS